MTYQELQELEEILIEEVGRRRKLGEYSADAKGLLLLAEALQQLTEHLLGTYPKIDK